MLIRTKNADLAGLLGFGCFRLAKAVTELAKHSIRADKAIKERQKLENLNSANEEQGGSHELF